MQFRCPQYGDFLEHPMAWDPQESTVEAEDILNMQNLQDHRSCGTDKSNHGSTDRVGHPEFSDHSLELPLQNVLH